MTNISRRELDELVKRNPDILVEDDKSAKGYDWETAVADFPTSGAPLPQKKGKNKYNAKKATVDGVTFDSQKEAMRYIVLDRMQRSGEINDLRLQPAFTLQKGFTDREGKKHRAIKYKADFSYRRAGESTLIVEDTKGVRTAVFNLKWKMVIKQHLDEDIRFILT